MAAGTEETQRAIQHLESIRQDVRDEMKRRMEQRDKYSIQLTVSLGALVALGFSSTGFNEALLAVPLVSIYFTVLIQFSYRVHSILATYLRDKIEPALAERCGTPKELEWETYYKEHARAIPGIRSSFFVYALWVINTLSMLYLWVGATDPGFRLVLWVASALYGGVTAWITWASRRG